MGAITEPGQLSFEVHCTLCVRARNSIFGKRVASSIFETYSVRRTVTTVAIFFAVSQLVKSLLACTLLPSI